MKTFTSLLQYFLLITIIVSNEINEDWSASCPAQCKCTWAGGRRTADCQGSRLAALPQFGQPDKIQCLQLNNNPITELRKNEFLDYNLINLQKVYLSNCNISTLHPDAFRELVLVIELDLSNNKIHTLLPGTFAGNIRIRKLWLNNNPLKSLLDYNFPSIPHLRLLDLSNCHLRLLTVTTFKHLKFLELLSLKDNDLTVLSASVFSHFTNLKSLNLGNNSWICDCRLSELWSWVVRTNLLSQPTRCRSPARLENVSWDRLEKSNLSCPPVVEIIQPETSVQIGSTVLVSCRVSGQFRKFNWFRGGVIVTNTTQGTDMESMITSIGKEKDGVWNNLTIIGIGRSGSGTYSCIAESERGATRVNVTLVIADSVKHPKKEKTNLLYYCFYVSLCTLGIFLIIYLWRRKKYALKLNIQERNFGISVIEGIGQEHQNNLISSRITSNDRHADNDIVPINRNNMLKALISSSPDTIV